MRAATRMRAAASHETIPVDDLRVGMFVHLDMSWMAHPFPLGSFKLASEAQLAQVRALGLERVRWSPTQSDALLPPAEAAAIAPAAPPVSAETLARLAHRRALAEQRAALQVCEQQFAEAARECRQLTELATDQPQAARAKAEQLSNALVEKMLGAQELCIRLLTDAAGDKASTHALNVATLSLLMGRSVGFSAGDLADLGVGAVLHDIGKLELPDRVRHHEDHFSAGESRGYEAHVAHGVQQARRMGLSAGATLVIAQHHEHADGSGFPLHLGTERMTAAARIVALVNRYDELCNPNVAARALTPHEALSLLFAQGRTKFDTAVLGGFIRMMGVYPAGSTVQLTDDRYGLVVGVNATRPLRPRVRVHQPGVPRDEALIVDLEAATGLGIRRSLRPAQLPAAALDDLAPRPRVAYFFEPLPAAPDAPGAP
jgi:putative nucleotidyltransferase with HDIG domain